MEKTQYSYSRVETYEKCPFKYKLRYIEKLDTLPSDDPACPLTIGTMLHHAVEKGIEEATTEYYNSYPIITDLHAHEVMKVEQLVPQVIDLMDLLETLSGKLTFEYKINLPEFKGFIDLLEEVTPGCYNIYDFKYSNNVDSYMESKQLHVYQYYFEKLTNFKVLGLYYIFVPKTMIRQKKTENLYQFRKRLLDTLKGMKSTLKKVEFDYQKVFEYKQNVAKIECDPYFKKNESRLCDFCEFKDYCKSNGEVDYMIINKRKGEEIMVLPSTQRVQVESNSFKKIWIYGAPFTGKTTFADDAPTPINLNTDGNVKYVTMPRIPIKDEVTVSGRVSTRKFAWEVFQEAIAELEKGSDFETIIVDLLEDTREHCRLYMYDKLNIEHESDAGYGKGYDQIKTEFLGTLKKLLNLPYNIILISHEDLTKDITKKGGDKVTAIKPNLQEALANKIAGMVDIVARVIIDEDDSRWLSFKTKEVEFGGGRLKGIKKSKVALKWSELCKVYDEAISGATIESPSPAPRRAKAAKVEPTPVVEEVVADEIKEAEEAVEIVEPVTPVEETPKRRRKINDGLSDEEREAFKAQVQEVNKKYDEYAQQPEPVVEEQPTVVRRTRRVRN